MKRGRQICRSGARSSDRFNGGLPTSEEHTSELQSPCNLVCRLLLEKKKIIITDDDAASIGPHASCNHIQCSQFAGAIVHDHREKMTSDYNQLNTPQRHHVE